MTDDLLTRMRSASSLGAAIKALDEGADEIERLRESLAGVVGLVQLIASRDDLPAGLDDLMLLNHRMTDARAALGDRHE